MHALSRLVFGSVVFDENEEYREFQFKLLCAVLLGGAVATIVFVLGEASQLNPLKSSHLYSMTAFSTVSLLLWLALRGRKERFLAVGWTYETACLLEYASALILVPQDELRVLWFLTNVPGVYILLGQRAGAVITLACVAFLLLANPHLAAPYSPNALATLVVALLYQGVFFHIYRNRSISYFSRMRESQRKLQHLATHDTLTGVMNARAYYATADQLIQLARRHGTPAAVLFVDLDHFKSINDTHGHAAGDTVLKAVASTLAESIRASDALGRIGGEEFSIFLPNTNLDGALQLAEGLRQKIEALLPVVDSGPLRVTASIGVAQSRPDETRMLGIQQRADAAMYIAKSRGRNRVSSLSETETTAATDTVKTGTAAA